MFTDAGRVPVETTEGWLLFYLGLSATRSDGAADTYTALAFRQVDELLDYLKQNSEAFQQVPARRPRCRSGLRTLPP